MNKNGNSRISNNSTICAACEEIDTFPIKFQTYCQQLQNFKASFKLNANKIPTNCDSVSISATTSRWKKNIQADF